MCPSEETQLREADQFVEELRRAIHHGFGDVATAKTLLRTVLRRRMWTDRIINMTDRRKAYRDFMRFVSEPPVEGLGTTLDTLKTLAKGDEELCDLLERETTQRHGGDRRSDVFKSDNITLGPPPPPAERGTSTAYFLRRLRKDRPDLHAQVIAGKKKPHAAMIEAGFRDKTISIPLDPAGATRAILRHFAPEQVAELIALLREATQ